MSDQQKKALIAAVGAFVVVAVGVWTLWGAGWWSQREQDQVLSDLAEVAEANTAEAESGDDIDGTEDEEDVDVPTSTTESTDASTTTSTVATEADDATETTGAGEDTSTSTTTTTSTETTSSEPSNAEAATAESSSTTTTAATANTEQTTSTSEVVPQEPVVADFDVIETIPHDTNAFTQGLEISNGRLFESTGRVGQSSIREIDLETGEVLRNTAVPEVFAEGLTVVGDTAIQLTWRDSIAYRYDLDTFELLESYTYQGEGWGLCLASEGSGNLVMSDGSSTLTFRDPDTFALLGSIDVRFNGNPIELLNELECVGDTVWANIWRSGLIVEIDPASGAVLTVLDIDDLRPESTQDDSEAVWNGLAWDPTDGTLLVTGKLWPTIYRLDLN